MTDLGSSGVLGLEASTFKAISSSDTVSLLDSCAFVVDSRLSFRIAVSLIILDLTEITVSYPGLL